MPELGFDYSLEIELQDTIETYMDCDSFLEYAKVLRQNVNEIDEGILTDDALMDVWMANQIYSMVSAWRKTYDS